MGRALLFILRLPTLVLLGPIIAGLGWAINKGGGKENFAKGVLHNTVANIIVAFGVGICGFVFADPVMERLNELRGGQIAIKEKTESIDEKMDRILALLKAQSGIKPDAQAEAGITATIKNLLRAGEGARKRAGEKLAEGNTDGARSELRQLAAQQEDAITDAAQTWLDIGNLAFLNDTQDALDAFIRVTELTPNNADGWNQLGHLYRRIGDLNKAISAYETVQGLGEQQGDKELLAKASGNLGAVEWTRGNEAGAVAHYQQALALYKELRRKTGMANQYSNLGVVEQSRRNLDGAVTYYQQALALYKELRSKEGMAANYGNLGTVEKTRGNLDGAVSYYQQAQALDEELGSKEGMASNYGNLGLVEQTRDNMDGACAYWRQSYDLYVQIEAVPMVERVGGWLRDAGCEVAPEE